MRFENRVFEKRIDRRGVSVSACHFFKCEFQNCSSEHIEQTGAAVVYRDLIFEDCSTFDCHVGPVVCDNVLIKNLDAKEEPLFLWGTLLKHVRFEGQVGKLKVNTSPNVFCTDQSILGEFRRQRALFYENVDWALDIRDALFLDCDIDGIPASRILRAPETQVVVKRGKLIKNWQTKVSDWNHHWKFVLELFENSTESDIVLVAPRARNRTFKNLLKGIEELCDLGIAER